MMADLLKLEINGHFHWITKSTLAKYPNSKLGLLSANKRANNTFIQDSRLFAHILDWLKFGKIRNLTVNDDIKQLKELAKEINVLDLVEYLETMENEFEVIGRSKEPTEVLEQSKYEETEVKDVDTQPKNIPKALLALSILCSTIATMTFCLNF